MGLIIMITMMLIIIIYMLFCLMYYKTMMYMENMSSYECGFDPYSMTRLVFSYRFFLISILFIIFDVEIVLMLPIPFMYNIIMCLIILMLFIIILIAGLVYEYYCGSLEWLNVLN